MAKISNTASKLGKRGSGDARDVKKRKRRVKKQEYYNSASDTEDDVAEMAPLSDDESEEGGNDEEEEEVNLLDEGELNEEDDFDPSGDEEAIDSASPLASPEESTENSRPVKLSNAINKILSSTIPQDKLARPILSKDRNIEKVLDNRKLEAKARRLISAEKRKTFETGHVIPTITTNLERERKMRKVATRGVVQLFNAIRVAQRVSDIVASDGIQKNAQEVPLVSKRTFLDMLKQAPVSEHDAAISGSVVPSISVGKASHNNARDEKGKSAPESQGVKASAEGPVEVAWVKDDFMTKSAKHWDEDSD